MVTWVSRLWRSLGAAATAAALLLGASASPAAAAPCDAPITNPVACENTKPGNPASEWDVSGAGDPTHPGLRDRHQRRPGPDRRVQGRHRRASAYRLDIYRMGYYGGSGARKVATVQPSALAAADAARLPDRARDRPRRLRQLGASPRPGPCRPTRSRASTSPSSSATTTATARATSSSSCATTTARSDLLFQTVGHDVAGLQPVRRQQPLRRARPPAAPTRSATTGRSRRAATRPRTGVFNAEYPMVRWLERERLRRQLHHRRRHRSPRRRARSSTRSFLSVGHDEYWSGSQRANVEAARAAGVAPRVLQRQRGLLEDALGAEHRRHGHALPDARLATRRRTRTRRSIRSPTSGPARGATRASARRPTAAGPRTRSPARSSRSTLRHDARSRCRRPTARCASGATRRSPRWRRRQVATLPDGTLGYEWDEDLDNGVRPAGLVPRSPTTTVSRRGRSSRTTARRTAPARRRTP